MTADALVAEARAVGVRLRLAADGGVRVASPETPAAVAAVTALRDVRDAVRDLLRAESELPIPASPCRLCARPVVWVADWPTPGAGAWLCAACAQQPVPSLRAVLATLTDDEQHQLDAEAAGGDALAQLILTEVLS